MNPLFPNAPMGPGGDMSYGQAPQQPVGPTQGIVPQQATIPGSMVPQTPPPPAELAVPQQPVQRSGIQPAGGFQQAPLAKPPQIDPMAMHEQSRKLSSGLMNSFKSPEALQLQKSIPGVDWGTAHAELDTARDAQANAEVPVPYVQQYGTQNAVKTAFDGGSYMDIASSFLGKSEGKDHAVLTDVFKKQLGQNIDPRQTPWCAAYVGSVLQQGGVKGTGSLAARSYLKYGEKVNTPDATRGDIVVFGRNGDPSKGHVGFIDHISKDGKTVFVLGGNQSNSVSISARPVNTVLGIRRPPAPEEIQKYTEERIQKQEQQAPRGTVSPMPRNEEPTPLSQLSSAPGAVQSIFSRGS